MGQNLEVSPSGWEIFEWEIFKMQKYFLFSMYCYINLHFFKTPFNVPYSLCSVQALNICSCMVRVKWMHVNICFYSFRIKKKYHTQVNRLIQIKMTCEKT